MTQNDKVNWQVEGMTCTNCALSVEKYLKSQNQNNVNVDFANAEVSFDWNDENNLTELQEGISKLGYKVINNTDEEENSNKTFLGSIDWKLAICIAFTIPLLLSMIPLFSFLHNPLIQCLLTLPVMIIGIDYFGGKAYNSLKNMVLSMDVLIVLGSSAAFIYSFVGFVLGLGHEYLFFETAASIITIVLIGNYIEHKSVKQTTTAIKELIQLQPKIAKKVVNVSNHNWQETEISNLQLNDLVLVNTGDKIPVDGVINWGNAQTDESMLTGESEMVSKETGSKVFAGTIVQNGSIIIEVTQLPQNSTLQQIINLVKRAQSQKPPIQKLSDRISEVFIPLILLIALACFFVNYYWWHVDLSMSILRSVAVLVVACPCAMGLATPIAVMVGLGKLSKLGMLVKGGTTIEQLGKIKNMVFDKTGTLTTGVFNIENAKSGIEPSEFKAIVKSLEIHSTHPLAKSILQKLSNVNPFPLTDVKEIKGMGLIGKDQQGNTYSIGSYQLAKDAVTNNDHQIYVLKNNKLIGWIDMQDTVKENVNRGLHSLKNNGIELYLLSGDKEEKTAPIANQLEIEKYYANKLPDEKLNIIEQIATTGTTAMVGDGINDAPALAKADLGISLSSATDVAIQTASVIMLNNNFTNLSKAIDVGKGTTKTIRQNLFWAFFYNLLMIPLAFTGFLHPIFAAIAMALSDVFVIGNTIRFKNQPVD